MLGWPVVSEWVSQKKERLGCPVANDLNIWLPCNHITSHFWPSPLSIPAGTSSTSRRRARLTMAYSRVVAACAERKELWQDPDFPATQTSVFYHQTPPFTFSWRRPKVRQAEGKEGAREGRGSRLEFKQGRGVLRLSWRMPWDNASWVWGVPWEGEEEWRTRKRCWEGEVKVGMRIWRKREPQKCI